MILKAFKYRIYPNAKQIEHLNKSIGCARYIYNKGLELKIKQYEKTGKTLSCFDLTNGMLKEEKTKNDWLKEPYSQVLQMSLRNLDNAFTMNIYRNYLAKSLTIFPIEKPITAKYYYRLKYKII